MKNENILNSIDPYYVKIIDHLINVEGLRKKAYRCKKNFLTIGVGRNLQTKGITHTEALFLALFDIEECINDLKKIFYFFDKYPESIRIVLLDIRFACGNAGFLSFKKMIKAVKMQNWQRVKDEIIDSKFYREDERRGKILTDMIGELK